MGLQQDVRETDPTDLHVPVDWVPVTPGAAHPVLRALRANTAGVIAVRTARSGDDYRDMNFAAGETRYGIFTQVGSETEGTTSEGIEGGV